MDFIDNPPPSNGDPNGHGTHVAGKVFGGPNWVGGILFRGFKFVCYDCVILIRHCYV